MKKIITVALILIASMAATTAKAQTSGTDWGVSVLNAITPAPALYPGGIETVSFTLTMSGANSYTFSSNSADNHFASIVFSFTKLDPTNSAPTGPGAKFFTWNLVNQTGANGIAVYSWVGNTKDTTMNGVVPNNIYPIIFSNLQVKNPATQAQNDIGAKGQFTDPTTSDVAINGGTLPNQDATNTYSVNNPLPVLFGNTSASITNGILKVNFTTLTEKNNDHFNIEASTDGKNFKEIGTLKSTATNGTSNTAIDYTFSLNVQNGLALGSLMLLGIFAIASANPKHDKRRMIGSVITVAIICAVLLAACRKSSDTVATTKKQDVYIRLVQVDIDGTKSYSKVISAVNE